MGTAKFQATLQATLPDWRGSAQVYRVDPPMTYRDDADDPKTTDLVVVSAVVAYSGPETYIFPARKVGDSFETINMLELHGSFRGALDHAQALKNAGYEALD